MVWPYRTGISEAYAALGRDAKATAPVLYAPINAVLSAMIRNLMVLYYKFTSLSTYTPGPSAIPSFWRSVYVAGLQGYDY